ncbi:MAG: hypothetical protein J6Y43_03820 [Clostridia bacterium]|nr:hypothetical protein [Clostridia bacterium]
MKKSVVVTVLLISLLFVWGINAQPVFYGYSEDITLYSKRHGSDCNMISVFGIGYIFVFTKTGESFSADKKNFDIDKFLKDFNAEKVFEEHTFDTDSKYFYSKDIKYCEILYGKKVNIQLSVKNDRVTVGTPVIYGSY